MVERRAISVDGIVQGVGFRPFVHGLAARLHLQGFVRNQTGNVRIEVEGRARLPGPLSRRTHAPPAAAGPYRPRFLVPGFSSRRRAIPHRRQAKSTADGQVLISPDVATCAACLGRVVRSGQPPLSLSILELHALRAALDDHHRQPLRSAADHDGRLPHVRGVPRRNTRIRPIGGSTPSPPVAGVADRHCGSWTTKARQIAADDPLAAFAQAIRAGRIGAMKGVGGYHLICDATQRSRRGGTAAAKAPRREAAWPSCCGICRTSRRFARFRRWNASCSSRRGRRSCSCGSGPDAASRIP